MRYTNPHMKIACTPDIAKNWWSYYLVKCRLKKRALLSLNTLPDGYSFDLTTEVLNENRDLFKTIFMLVRRSRLEYHAASGAFTVYSADKKARKTLRGDILSLETFEKGVDVFDTIEEYDQDLFKVSVRGAAFLIRKKVASDVYVLKENFLEDQYAFIYPYMKGATVVDIGANIGDTAVLFCREGARSVHAYEPHPYFFDLAGKNIALNHFTDRVTMHKRGIGGKESVCTLRDDSAFGPTGCFGLKDGEHGAGSVLQVIPFSKALEGLSGQIVVKMDCEGFEFEAIPSCPVATLRKVTAMAIEFHKDPAPILEYLSKAGFETEMKSDVASKDGRCGILFAERT